MTGKERFLKAINREKPDRLPVANHFVMPSFLKNHMNGISVDEFFEETGIDPILWTISHKGTESKGEYFDPLQKDVAFLESRRISSDNWRIIPEEVPNQKYPTTRYNFVTPEKTLTMTLQADQHSAWVTEHLIKDKKDIEIIAKYATQPLCDVDDINAQVEAFGDRGIVRGWICCFDIFGQPGTWQDASCLFGIENLIMETYDDPEWVHEFLEILYERKAKY
ncbi:MAG: hypothetical protein IJF23_04530, partial [Clostridia bacterium]|nr:hypothetical protein [Clostridia bacterium]